MCKDTRVGYIRRLTSIWQRTLLRYWWVYFNEESRDPWYWFDTTRKLRTHSTKSGKYQNVIEVLFSCQLCIILNTCFFCSSHELRQNSKFSYEEIREVHKRRYLLQPIALEVFSGDGRNFLLSFPRKVRNKVYQRLMSVATSIADNAQQSVAGQSRSANVEQSSGIFSSLIGETSVTQRWVVRTSTIDNCYKLD